MIKAGSLRAHEARKSPFGFLYGEAFKRGSGPRPRGLRPRAEEVGNMQRIAKFERVTGFESAELPVRATAGSAGYDIKTPVDIRLAPGETALVETGLRCRMADGWVLLIVPRSGLGFRYRLQLDNTVGVIDQDYYFADNEGHIKVKITNDSREGKLLEIPAGKAFAQGIFVPYGITEDDEADGQRRGGFGSTDSPRG